LIYGAVARIQKPLAETPGQVVNHFGLLIRQQFLVISMRRQKAGFISGIHLSWLLLHQRIKKVTKSAS